MWKTHVNTYLKKVLEIFDESAPCISRFKPFTEVLFLNGFLSEL